MTLDEILTHHAPCRITLSDDSMIYCRRMNAGEHPHKGPTVRIEDADGKVRYFSADEIKSITPAPPLPS